MLFRSVNVNGNTTSGGYTVDGAWAPSTVPNPDAISEFKIQTSQNDAMFGAMVLMGFSLGIATTLSLTNVVDLASAAAMGTVMSLRITGNRIGQVAVPFIASLIAAATGF